MSTFRVVRILEKDIAMKRGKDAFLNINVLIVHLEIAYGLQNYKIQKDSRTLQTQMEPPTALFVQSSN